MRERPILFSAPMVRALLAGTKTQTRRIVKPVPGPEFWDHAGYELVICDDGLMRFAWKADGKVSHLSPEVRCPYGVRGDHLWVRESIHRGDACARYSADGSVVNLSDWRWKRDNLPSIHCPRSLSRITLEIAGVRVERLDQISEADAIAEGLKVFDRGNGVRQFVFPNSPYDQAKLCHGDAGLAYMEGWEQINGTESRDANPWVWAISFKRVKP